MFLVGCKRGGGKGGWTFPLSAPSPAQLDLAPLQPSLEAGRAMGEEVGREAEHVVGCEGH